MPKKSDARWMKLTAKRFDEIQVGSRDLYRFFSIMFPKKGGKS